MAFNASGHAQTVASTFTPSLVLTKHHPKWLLSYKQKQEQLMLLASEEPSSLVPPALRGTDVSLLNADGEDDEDEDGVQQDFHGPEYHKQMRIFLIAVMIFVSLFGNALVAQRIHQRWPRRSRMTILCFHLMLADLAVTIFTMVSQVIWEVMDRVWLAGDVFCRLNKLFQTFAICSSNFVLVCIALDRFVAIVFPLKTWLGPNRLAIIAWGLSLLPSIPNLYTFHVVAKEGGTYCISKFYSGELSVQVRQIYMIIIIMFVSVLPCAFLVLLYSGILISIARQDRKFSRRDQNQVQNSLLPRAKMKTLNLSITVVVMFLITNLPYMIYEIFIAFNIPVNLNPNAAAFMGIISASNSAINPFVYLLFHSKTRLAQRITSYCCPCTEACFRRMENRAPQLRIVFRKSASSSSSLQPRSPRVLHHVHYCPPREIRHSNSRSHNLGESAL